MSDLKINNITDRTGDSGPVIAGVSTVTSTGAFTVPVGPTEYRGGRGRGIFAGMDPSGSNIDKIEIATTGNSVSFGTLLRANKLLLQLHHQLVELYLVDMYHQHIILI